MLNQETKIANKASLNKLYKCCAQKAFNHGIDPGNEEQLVKWIWQNCSFNDEILFYLVLGIGSELADLQAQSEGFENAVVRAYLIATTKLKN